MKALSAKLTDRMPGGRKPLRRRNVSMKYPATTRPEDVSRCIDQWNALLDQLPGDGMEIFFEKEPEIKVEQGQELSVYPLYANDPAWELFQQFAESEDTDEQVSSGVFSETIYYDAKSIPAEPVVC